MVYRNFSSDLRHMLMTPPTCLLLARLQGQSMNCCRVHPDQSDPSQQEGSSSGVGVRPSHMCREVFHVAPRCTCLHSLRQRDTGSLSRVMQQNFLFGDKDGAKGRREKKAEVSCTEHFKWCMHSLSQKVKTLNVRHLRESASCDVVLRVQSEFYSPLYTHQVCQQER